MSDAEFPPRRAVITAAAVAVGHIRHSIADSRMMRNSAGNEVAKIAGNDSAVRLRSWKASNKKCHFAGLSSPILTLQKVISNI